MGWELWGFLGVEGLDKGIYGEIRGKKFGALPGAQKRGTWGTRLSQKQKQGQGPGLKPVSSRGWFQGPEGPCSLRVAQPRDTHSSR